LLNIAKPVKIKDTNTRKDKNMKTQTGVWLEMAEEDMETAGYNLKGKYYLWAIFLCQQAIEKAFKAIYFEQAEEVPPRKHDLVVLARLTNLIAECDEKRLDFLRRLTVYYLETRYPEERTSLAAKCTEEHTREILSQTGEVFQWLKSKLKQ